MTHPAWQISSTPPEVPWKEIVKMRHILAHDYFGVDLNAVWSVVEKDILSLKSKIQAILSMISE